MKHKPKIWLFLTSVMLILTGCGQTVSSQDETSSVSDSNISESSSEIISSSENSSVISEISSEIPLPETTPLSDAKLLDENSVVTVGGVVGKIWIGSTQVVPQGFYLFDETTTLFVFGPDVASKVSLGNYVIVTGILSWYIIETDIVNAEKVGYNGAVQIASPTLIHNDKKTNTMPQGGVVETTIRAITEIPVSTKLTSTLYRSAAKIIRVDGAGFKTYYFVDLSLDVQLLLYTSANGNDHSWLDAYVNQTRMVTFIVHNARVTDGIWRITPVAVYEETTASSDQLVDFALRRLASQFEEAYYVSADIDVTTVDVQVPGATITYASNQSAISIAHYGEKATLTIDNSAHISVEITIRVQYQSVDKVLVVTVLVAPGMPDIETTPISIVRGLTPGAHVAVEGILMGYAYYGTTSKQGFYIGDESSQIVIYVADKSSLERVQPGEKVIVSGDLTLSTRHGLSIDNAVIEFQDYQNHPFYEDVIESIALTDLLLFTVADNITSRVFRVRVRVEVTTGMYSNVYLHDADDDSISVILYSTGSATSNAVARALEGQTLEVYMTLISRRYADPGANDYWRAEMLAAV